MIVSNASPLIYLAKIGMLDLLEKIYDRIQIPLQVKIECVDKGKQAGYVDAFLIEKYIEKGFIIVEELPKHLLRKAENIALEFQIDTGEAQAILLAVYKGKREILIDEKRARFVAKQENLSPRGTLYVILKAIKRGLLNKEEAINKVNELIKKNFYISTDVYKEFLRLLKEI